MFSLYYPPMMTNVFFKILRTHGFKDVWWISVAIIILWKLKLSGLSPIGASSKLAPKAFFNISDLFNLDSLFLSWSWFGVIYQTLLYLTLVYVKVFIGNLSTFLLLLKAMVLKVWCPDQHHQHHLGTCYKCRFSDPTPSYWIR